MKSSAIGVVSAVTGAVIAVAVTAWAQNLTVNGSVTANGSGTHSFLGNLGIGTASPGARLEIAGHTRLAGAVAQYRVLNVAAPTAASDAATKAYADALGSGPTYQGRTTASYTGNLGGPLGANAKCQIDYPGSHMCTQGEMLRSGLTSFGAQARVFCDELEFTSNSGEKYYCSGVTHTFNNSIRADVTCSEYTTTTSLESGSVLADGTFRSLACTASVPIHCCK